MLRSHRSILMISLLSGFASYAHSATFTFSNFNAGQPSTTLETIVTGINDSGQVVGYDSAIPGFVGFLYNGASFTSISGSNFLNGINNAGVMIGSNTQGGFVDNGGIFSILNDPLANGGPTTPQGINNSGEIVGDYSLCGGCNSVGFVDNGGVFTDFTVPGAVAGSVMVNGVNDAGEIVGSYQDSSGLWHGFLDNGGTFTTIDAPLRQTIVTGINNAGQIVGYTINGPLVGFLDNNGTFSTIDDPAGNGDTVVRGINNLGQIVGYTGGGQYGFVASATPEPASLTLVFAVVLGAAAYRRRMAC